MPTEHSKITHPIKPTCCLYRPEFSLALQSQLCKGYERALFSFPTQSRDDWLMNSTAELYRKKHRPTGQERPCHGWRDDAIWNVLAKQTCRAESGSVELIEKVRHRNVVPVIHPWMENGLETYRFLTLTGQPAKQNPWASYSTGDPASKK